MSNRAYYLISYRFTPHLCSTINGNAVISEHPTSVISRTSKEMGRGDTFHIGNWEKITKKQYTGCKKHNPGCCAYIRLHRDDYSARKPYKDDDLDAQW